MVQKKHPYIGKGRMLYACYEAPSVGVFNKPSNNLCG